MFDIPPTLSDVIISSLIGIAIILISSYLIYKFLFKKIKEPRIYGQMCDECGGYLYIDWEDKLVCEDCGKYNGLIKGEG